MDANEEVLSLLREIRDLLREIRDLLAAGD